MIISESQYETYGGGFIDGIPNQEEKCWWKSETGGASRFFNVIEK